MNLYDDESLKQEVIYLHSLWHQGPPTRNPIPSPSFNPIRDPIARSRMPNYIPPADLQLLSRYGSAVSSQIIPRNPNPHHLYNNKRPRPDSGREWPVNESTRPSPVGSGWPEFNPCKKARPISAEEKAKFAINKLQRDIHRTCREFFSGKSGEEDSSSVATGGDESDSDDEGDGEEGSVSKEFQFLSKVFEEKGELKDYYVKNNGNGDFWCLVCGGTGEKSCRKFKSCLALVQHSLAIHNSKSQHRALAQVVCNVLGWDVNNPVASSQKESQGVETVLESASETSLEVKNPQAMSVDEQAKAAVVLMQQNASSSLKDTFAGLGDGTEEEKGDEFLSEKLELISRVFSENVELKTYYESKYEGGNFVCMVCCAVTDKKMIKRFRHCYGLVQHCTKVPKIKKEAHKVFARFVCKLLGWEFDRIPRRETQGGETLVGSNSNQKPSLVAEEHLCEDTQQEKEEACVGG